MTEPIEHEFHSDSVTAHVQDMVSNGGAVAAYDHDVEIMTEECMADLHIVMWITWHPEIAQAVHECIKVKVAEIQTRKDDDSQ